MSSENKLLIIQPDGPQGRSLGLSINDETKFKALDVEVGKLNPGQRKNVENIKKIAIDLGIGIIKP